MDALRRRRADRWPAAGAHEQVTAGLAKVDAVVAAGDSVVADSTRPLVICESGFAPR
jgi:hypothetical protein